MEVEEMRRLYNKAAEKAEPPHFIYHDGDWWDLDKEGKYYIRRVESE